jgi:sialidase-1
MCASPVKELSLWTSGSDGYHTYRIPSLIVTTQGTLLAFCEGRKTSASDHGDVDLLMKRSVDGGHTWSSQSIVHEEGGTAKVTIGNPCPVVDRDTGTIWLPFTRDNKRVLVTSSVDDGRTWATPRDISTTAVPADWTWVATGPGVGIQLAQEPFASRLVIPCDHRSSQSSGEKESYSHMMFSDDHGASWQIGQPIELGGNECQVVELDDGRLLVNTRMQNHFTGLRGVATSGDQGISWTPISHDPQLPCPRCQASLIKIGPKTLLLSNPNPGHTTSGKDKGARIDLTIRFSQDDGTSWPVAKRLKEGPAAYSCLAYLGDGTILCLYETGTTQYRETLTLARFDLDWLKTGNP